MPETKEFIEYYQYFKKIVLLHRKMKFGSNPSIPSVFSEKLTKLLFQYADWNNRDFDAKTADGKAVEIKATGSSNGTTTINLKTINDKNNIFGHIIWLYIDFKTDKFYFKKINIEALSENLKKINDNGRDNIILSKLIAFEEKVYEANTLQEIKS